MLKIKKNLLKNNWTLITSTLFYGDLIVNKLDHLNQVSMHVLFSVFLPIKIPTCNHIS